MIGASGGTISDGAIFAGMLVFLALGIVGAIALWQRAMDRERAEAELRAKRARVRNVISDRRLSRLHVIESDPGKLINTHPRRQP